MGRGGETGWDTDTPQGGCPQRNKENKPKPKRYSSCRPGQGASIATNMPVQEEGPGQIQEDPRAALLPHPPPNSPQNQTTPHGARLQCVHVHVFSSQSLNEVFAENLQFPHGLNLAKIAFLTLLGFNSNKPPLYYGTRSHCLDTARKSFIRKENGEGKREIKKGREEEERGDKQIKAAHFIRGTFSTRQTAGGPAAGLLGRGAFPQRRSHPRTRRIISGAASPPTHPPTLHCLKMPRGAGGEA